MTLGQELKEAANKQEQKKKLVQTVSNKVFAKALFEQAKEACKKANLENKRSIFFGEERSRETIQIVFDLLTAEDLMVKMHYNEGKESAYLHEDRASYYWLEISW